ncbi:phosphotransferase family protein [Sphaerisporangium viridialbum]|uniref:phosphotransferase family protein n=1 Tax=Sphaerisporangium viridialbum TaxID=46189 RepID=UPI003C783ADF
MMITVEDPRLTFARRTLGSVSVTSMPGLPAHLLTLTDVRDVLYVVKRHGDAGRFQREARAYATWVPQLGDLAPQMLAADPASCSLLLTLLPGRSAAELPLGSPAEQHAHHAAGATLRIFHQIAPAEFGDDIAARLAGRIRWWAERAHVANLISAAERHTLLGRADDLAVVVVEGAICHLDYQPRNWLIGPDGMVRVLDFEHARLDARIRDFARLEHRQWRLSPHLRREFFDGYGQPPDEAEQDLLARFGVIEALTALVRGHERGDPGLIAHGRNLINQFF